MKQKIAVWLRGLADRLAPTERDPLVVTLRLDSQQLESALYALREEVAESMAEFDLWRERAGSVGHQQEKKPQTKAKRPKK